MAGGRCRQASPEKKGEGKKEDAMIQIRNSMQRGHANHGWLDSYHTFSFADYYDPEFMGFRSLRVINEDKIEGGTGFPRHGHRDMEIVTVLLEGALAHKDTLGSAAVIRPGEVQRMTAGTGIEHSEYNHSKDEVAHLLQIWLLPEKQGLKPSYEQKNFSEKLEQSAFVLVGSRDGREGSVTIHQDVSLYWGRLNSKKSKLVHPVSPGRSLWLQMMRGEAALSEHRLASGDGVAVTGETKIDLSTASSAEFLLFDLI
jgi:redox-sensitive bicupin YhaK (pirin superfamily)